MAGIPLGKVQQFRSKNLTETTATRYLAGLAACNSDLLDKGVVWADLSDLEQDLLLSDTIVEWHEEGRGYAEAAALLAAATKVAPRSNVRTEWKCLKAWRAGHEPKQAAALPRDVVLAMAVSAVIASQPAVATAIIRCFTCLLRASEALQLRMQDVLFVKGEV